MVTLLYFAWVREKIGRADETLPLPAGVTTVASLITYLSARDAGSAEALADHDRLRVAVNETHVDLNHPIRDGDEIAIFPPVTGG
ncbi:molybdopterin converting factor subunit 1 [Govanella unica]|uniref:Molybdopterin synthase sulfur carrier subunit n=1 Tax=Govanella unica TaxID=2975056 RepID=A0A9X3TZT6_9PROT|nr:molybdopterin converting factor subunit 1 [Govania unica]MDA5194785.1 molybdopterin converting factor subunit 1 [Govania unica]